MSTKFRSQMKEVMQMAWSFVRKNGYSMSEALKCAWANLKLKAALKVEIGSTSRKPMARYVKPLALSWKTEYQKQKVLRKRLIIAKCTLTLKKKSGVVSKSVTLLKSHNYGNWKSHATLTLLAKQDLAPFGYNMIDPLKSWCWGSILFYPFKISRFS